MCFVVANREIRDLIQNKRIRYWEVAAALNTTDSTLSKKLRRELPNEEKEKIKNIIEQISKASR